MRGTLFRGVERVPATVEPRVEPAGEVHRTVRRRHADVAEIARAVARRDVHAPAERDRKMGVVAADARSSPRRPPTPSWSAARAGSRTRCGVDEIADRLDATPAGRGVAEQLPGDRQQALGIAVAAPEQKDQRLLGQRLDRRLLRARRDDVRQSGVVDQRIGADSSHAGRRDDAAAPVAEGIAIRADRQRRDRDQVIRPDDIGRPRVVDVQHEDHRCRLRTLVDQFTSDTDLHDLPYRASATRSESMMADRKPAQRGRAPMTIA